MKDIEDEAYERELAIQAAREAGLTSNVHSSHQVRSLTHLSKTSYPISLKVFRHCEGANFSSIDDGQPAALDDSMNQIYWSAGANGSSTQARRR